MNDSSIAAFPVTAGHEVYSTGLSLRDWFAGQALQGDMASQSADTGEIFANDAPDLAARCYAIADAMLAERGKGDE